MTAYLECPEIWQESWDRQQAAFMPDREHRFAAMLDAVAATTAGRPPRLLDLAGGTGTIALRTLDRFPRAELTVVDQDPVLLAIAQASLHGRATIVDADLGDPAWRAKLPQEDFDAVLTATALHWLPADRVAALYAEVREVLRPGGVFANADHMPEESLPGLSTLLRDRARAVRATQPGTRPAPRPPGTTGGGSPRPTSSWRHGRPSATGSIRPRPTTTGHPRPSGTSRRCARPASARPGCCGGAAPTPP
jgi:SAM-dependent methyltransferase